MVIMNHPHLIFIINNNMFQLTVCCCHITYAFQSELLSCLKRLRITYCDSGNLIHFLFFTMQLFPSTQKIMIPKYDKCLFAYPRNKSKTFLLLKNNSSIHLSLFVKAVLLLLNCLGNFSNVIFFCFIDKVYFCQNLYTQTSDFLTTSNSDKCSQYFC